MSDQYHDRFSKASGERSQKSAFICKSCEKTYTREEAEARQMNCCNMTLSEMLRQCSSGS